MDAGPDASLAETDGVAERHRGRRLQHPAGHAGAERRHGRRRPEAVGRADDAANFSSARILSKLSGAVRHDPGRQHRRLPAAGHSGRRHRRRPRPAAAGAATASRRKRLRRWCAPSSPTSNQAPEIGGLSTTFSADVPQIFVDVDRTRAEPLGVSVADIFSTLGANFGSRYVNDFTLAGPGLPGQSAGRCRLSRGMPRTSSISMCAARPARWCRSGPVVDHHACSRRRDLPLQPFVAATDQRTGGAGGSSGAAMDAVERVAAETLPQGYGFRMVRAVLPGRPSGGQEPIVFGLALLFAYLFLVAQYESWMLPIAIILSLGAALFGAIAGADAARAPEQHLRADRASCC